eukprot:m.17888 g.17888  ORF g.17888 m.17888 type:complete len:69 (+) comp3544_c0_seq1:189-395(+)
MPISCIVASDVCIGKRHTSVLLMWVVALDACIGQTHASLASTQLPLHHDTMVVTIPARNLDVSGARGS